MAYTKGSILKRREPFGAPKGGPDMRPYNEIEIVGPSPVQTNVRHAEWGDQGGDNITIKPTTFGEVVDRPERELQRDYEILSEPPVAVDITQTVTRIRPGPGPEQQFREKEEAAGAKKSDKRVATPLAPAAEIQ